MSEKPNPSTGPDLAAGVASATIAEGACVVGHHGGEAVLVARVDGRCHAVGATCPHYGAPLAEGLIAGHAVRCPWHHAEFDLRTGECTRPPAFDDLPTFEVTEKDGIVRVAAKVAKPTPRRAAGPRKSAPDRVVVIGAGAAGVAAADALRREGFEGSITMVDADRDASVDRPNLSKDYLAGNAQEEWLPLRAPSWFEERGIERRLGGDVATLDLTQRRVVMADGTALPFDAALLATGASPVRLRMPGGERLLYLRTLADTKNLIRRVEEAGPGAKAVVVGAGFIGLEVAASLTARGLRVTVVAPGAIPLERVLGPELGQAVRGVHESHGVDFKLGVTLSAVDVGSVLLSDGSRLEAALVVAGVGVRPNTDLAARAGLVVDGGIEVDAHLATAAAAVYAAGDVARWRDASTREARRVEHWVAAQRQGRHAALNILGAGKAFDAVPFFWSAHFDYTIAYTGYGAGWDAREVDGDPAARDCTVRYLSRGRVIATATVGRDADNLRAELELERAAQVVR